ncbi:MAG: hypothetical protein MJ175_09465, partial [Clostridia bacterium]|nr:hypothetical protein [Clostridia bacterium]
MPESGSETKKKYAKILPVLHVMPPVLIGILALVYFRLCILTTGGLGGYFLPSAGIIAVLFAAVLNKKRLPDILGWIFYAAVPFLHFILLEAIQQHTRDMVQKMVWLNLIVYCLASWFVLFLLRKHGGTAVLITTVLAWFSAVANSVCWQFRSLPILPWDIYSIKTGLSVVGDYQYQYSDLFWLVQLSFAAIAVLGFCVQPKKPLPKLFHYIAAPVVGIVLTAVLLFAQTDRMSDTFGGYRYLFTPTVYYERNGSVVSFLSTLRYLSVKKPAGYDKKT